MQATMTIDQFVSAVNDTNTIFGVTFIKKTDGSLRNMQARMHVTRDVKGVLPEGHRKAEDRRNNVLTVFDMQALDKVGPKGAFRRINLSALRSCRLHGVEYIWDNDNQVLTTE